MHLFHSLMSPVLTAATMPPYRAARPEESRRAGVGRVPRRMMTGMRYVRIRDRLRWEGGVSL